MCIGTIKGTRMIYFGFIIAILEITAGIGLVSTATPVVMWHGIDDSCCDASGMGLIKKTIEDTTGAYVLSMQMGNSKFTDIVDSLFLSPDEELKAACDIITSDVNLKDGFHAVGFSQGGLLIRGLTQRCSNAKVKKLITVASPHQGVYGIPECLLVLPYEFCDAARKFLSQIAYQDWGQHIAVPATYWHDPLHEDVYRKGSTFLADINNERVINEEYKRKIEQLEKFVMVRMNNDTQVVPKDSEWFGFFKPGQAVETEPLEESDNFLNDRLGLRKLKNESKIDFLQIDGDHMVFTVEWFKNTIIEPYLKD